MNFENLLKHLHEERMAEMRLQTQLIRMIGERMSPLGTYNKPQVTTDVPK